MRNFFALGCVRLYMNRRVRLGVVGAWKAVMIE